MLFAKLRRDRTERMLAMIDWGPRPSLKREGRVGRHAAITEQQGSIRDQMRTFDTTAFVALVLVRL